MGGGELGVFLLHHVDTALANLTFLCKEDNNQLLYLLVSKFLKELQLKSFVIQIEIILLNSSVVRICLNKDNEILLINL